MACTQKKKSDSEQDVEADVEAAVLDNANEEPQSSASEDSQSSASPEPAVSNAQVINFFPDAYKTILNWNSIHFGQEERSIALVEEEAKYIELLEKNVLIGYNYPRFVPYDTLIGALEDSRAEDANLQRFFLLLRSFFGEMKEGTVDRNLARYVIEDEIAIISRQISYSREYGEYITGFRLGQLISGEQDRKYATVRVLAQYPNFESRVKLIVYFTHINGKWFINAIEGDMNELLSPYITKTRFEPSGTLGATQGF